MKKVVSGWVSIETEDNKMDWQKAGMIADFMDWSLKKNKDYLNELCCDYWLHGHYVIDDARLK